MYIAEVILGCLIDGLYLPVDSYLKRNKSNLISFGVAVVALLTFVPFKNNIINDYMSRLVIIKIFTMFRSTDKKMTIVQDTIGEIIMKFFKFLLIYAFLLFLIAVIPLNMLYDQTESFSCQFITGLNQILPTTEAECLSQGGTWL